MKVAKRQTKFYQNYLDNKLGLKKYQKVGVLLLVVVLAGFIGWVWEFILAEIDGGFQGLFIKGGNLLPWMNIYAYGAIIIMIVSYTFKRYPWVVFVLSAIFCGLLEWFAGWIVYTWGNGTRYWDYSNAWFGIGNINGFVCPASAFVFGLGALALIYVLLPACIELSLKMSKRAFLTLVISLFVIVMLDDVVNLILKNTGLPTAQDFYRGLGWEFIKS